MSKSSNNKKNITPYKKIKVLGQGSYGKAYLVECIADRTLQVLKQMDMRGMSESEKQEAYKEAEITKSFDHYNIIKVRDVMRTVSDKLWIVMDYADGGDLEKKLKSYQGS